MSPWFTTLPFLNLINWAPKDTYHTARFEKDMRYYVIRLSKDLLDDWVITLINGRIKTKLGQIRTLAFANFSDAFANFCVLADIRHQRNYQLKEFFSENLILMHLLPFVTTSNQDKTLAKAEAIKKTSLGKTARKTPTPTKNNEPFRADFTQIGFSF